MATSSNEQKRYRVTSEYKSVHQIIVEATSPEEAVKTNLNYSALVLTAICLLSRIY